MTDFDTLLESIPDDPFKGYYVNRDGGMSSMDGLPLISHITDNLYVGGCLDGVDLGDYFSNVFSLYYWEKYAVGSETVVKEWRMYDSHAGVEVADMDENILSIEEVADEVVSALDAGGNVLVHCQAGINRSNLTAALALMKWKGVSADEAIALLRSKRSPLVLANPAFEKYLRNIPTNDAWSV